MADCIYVLHNRLFNSEFELDNFLLNYRSVLEVGKVSDVVFSVNTPKLLAVKLLLDEKRIEAEKIATIKSELAKVKAAKGSVNEEEAKLVAPYTPVTGVLKIFRAENDRRLVNEFIEENLKQHLISTLFKDGLDEHYAKLLQRPEGTTFLTKSELDHAFKTLKNAWKLLGVTGSAVHKIMELLWNNKTDNEIFSEIGGALPINIISTLRGVKDAIKGLLGFGDDAIYIPEYPIIANTTYTDPRTGMLTKLLGYIDLVVIDKNGNVHVFDYKCSDKSYTDWNKTKLTGYKYLLCAYKMMLLALGINTSASRIGVIPIIFEDFNPTTGSITGIQLGWVTTIDEFTDLQNPANPYSRNLKKFIINETKKATPSSDFLEKTETQIKLIFPSYRFLKDLDDAIKDNLYQDLIHDDKKGKWVLKRKRNFGQNEFDSVEEYFDYIKTSDQESFDFNKSIIKRAIENEDPSILLQLGAKSLLDGEAVSREWFMNLFAPFCTGTGEWELIESPELDTLLIILMHNKVGGYYKVFILDNNDLRTKVKFKKGTSVLGSFVDDITPKQYGITPLEGTYGNINNMKVMLALNNFPEIINSGEKIEGIYSICPRRLLGYHASAKLLLDNFGELCRYTGIENNFGKKLHFQPAYESAILIIREVGIRLRESGLMNKIYSKYSTGALLLLNTLSSLILMKNELEEQFPDFKHYSEKGSRINFNTPQGKAYGKIMQAIAEILEGYYMQSMRDGSSIDHYLNNPEMQETNLRNIYKATTNAFEEFKRRGNKFAEEVREATQKLWKAKGYNVLRRNALNDERILYENMFEPTKNRSGLYQFKDPWDPNSRLDPAEREFLKFTLTKLALLRKPWINTEADVLVERNDVESGFFDVPLLLRKHAVGILTKSGRKGFTSWFKRQLNVFKNPQGEYSWKGFKENLKANVEGALNSEEADRFEKEFSKDMFRMFDVFESSDNAVRREELLRNNDIDIFEDHLQNILYLYANAKLRKLTLDDYKPILLAQIVQSAFEAATNNISLDRNISYLMKYTKAKIYDLSIVPEQYRILAKGLEKARVFTTYATLGFSFKAHFFQILEGVWKNVSRSGIKPLGENLFGINELFKAACWVLGDTKDHLKIVSLGELLNEQYALNDMDVNKFMSLLKDGQFPLNASSKAMWLTSSPDYFNRLTIFIAQMIKDGCFDAYKKKGMRLIYNWKEDKRFSLFAKGEEGKRLNLKEFNKQKALYHRMMEQFQKEGYKIQDKNGNYRDLQFDPMSDKPGDPIPRAYTNKLALSMKSFANLLYGYYNHEDLFLLKSLMLGASYTLFRTYWSSLKNRWWLKGDVYSGGEFIHMTNDKGQLLYKKYNVDENGKLISTDYVVEDTGEPWIEWKGSYQEGILLSLGSAIKTLFDPKSQLPISERAINIIHGKTGIENEDVIKARVNNYKLALHDLAIWLLIGVLMGTLLTEWLKLQEREDKNRNLSFTDETIRNVERVGVASLIASTQDLGAFGDLFSPLTDWTPPSFRYLNNFRKDLKNWIAGEKNFVDVVTENLTVARQMDNYWYQAQDLTK